MDALFNHSDANIHSSFIIEEYMTEKQKTLSEFKEEWIAKKWASIVGMRMDNYGAKELMQDCFDAGVAEMKKRAEEFLIRYMPQHRSDCDYLKNIREACNCGVRCWDPIIEAYRKSIGEK